MSQLTFDMDAFTQRPALDKLDRCTKAYLLFVAKFFNVSVPLNACKAEIKGCLAEQLVERGIVKPEKPKTVSAPEGLNVEVGAAAATATQALSSRVEAGAEALAFTQASGTDPMALIQARVDTEDLKLALRVKEVELETKTREVELMQLRIRALELDRSPRQTSTPVSMRFSTASSEQFFDVSRHISLVPPFRESEVDSYFSAFVRIAKSLNWPKDVWTLLLQCKLVGKAQGVCASLSIEESLDYEVVKATVLRAYELVPEAYRQKFCRFKKLTVRPMLNWAVRKKLCLIVGAALNMLKILMYYVT